uniref:(E)-beta-ocimene synthase, chloroplastic n=1 Tax=Matricaria chamomilla var. recutita TaxID=127986 RepID=TPS4_MATCR|nr:RecName: Full=(E)-beta-ocimene synthase, chloroplastic; AltName: Full=Terpene synthase 4; Flags: Precursor [Matricaria chamomilla var. recutita]AFM43737.1 terpene synthase 4 [Matricaria chamomilla var. recutita]
MAITHYQMASFQSSFHFCMLRKTLRQKSSLHFAKRCEATNKIFQTHGSVAIYQKTLWTHDLIDGLETDFLINRKEKVNELEVNVARMFMDYENGDISNLELLELIDNIERLGLGHRFQTNMKRVLDKIATVNENSLGLKEEEEEEEEEEDNLHALSLKFRILRQSGYRVSQDFQRKFKESRGGLTGGLKELLSIYEASYLSLEGEPDLHEAKLFATEKLLKLTGHENEAMKDHVNHALDIPLYRRMLRLEARWYIDAYGKRKDANKQLLELAILDFNIVQSAHKRDLQEVSKWWEKTGLVRKLDFIRDRLMECFFWSVGMVFEPQYYTCRVELTKIATLITTIDDIYDVYGSLNELKVFTHAVKRWDINAVENMPEYLQLGFLALYNTINEMGYETLSAQGINIIPNLARVWGELLEAFLVEAEWTHNNYMPTFKDYLDNAWRSVSGMVLLTHGYFLMNQDVKDDAIESLENFHDLFKWSSMLFRLYNDLAALADEIDKDKSPNAISCYMYEHSVSEEVAREHVKTLIDKAWMKMIEARIACSEHMTDPLIDMAINLARVSSCMYQYGDGIKDPEARTKDRVMSIIIKPFDTSEIP